jgi:hypothetical protein
MGSVVRVLTVVVLVPWLAMSAVLAREHVHDSTAAGHPPLVHTHVAPHHDDTAHASHLDLDGAEFSDADEHVMWLDTVAIAETAHACPQCFVVVSTHIISAPETVQHHPVFAPDEATLPHGPPRVSLSLRAPPSVFL